MTATPISQTIWDMKYRHRAVDGTPLDQAIEETWLRVAKALAEPEAPGKREAHAQAFFEIMRDFRFLPAGRILAGAGTRRKVTLFNCFVMGAIGDDMASIFENLKEAALTMQQGGGIGYDFSTLRPTGAPVRGVGADASGPLSFMDVWDAMCRTIMSAGARRGAMMATLACDHPDIEDFITAKSDPARLRMFNLSVLVTDAFMQAVRADADWPLVFGGKTFKTVRARTLWDAIMRATYDYAEPGVIFIDRINARNNLYYCESIHATNPCVTGDTWVMTTNGARQVTDLVGQPFNAVVDGKAYPSGSEGFFETGCKPLLKIVTADGRSLRLTETHQVRTVTTKTRHTLETAWKPAVTLEPGDEIILHNHQSCQEWAGPLSEEAGYLIGLLIGDGTLKSDKAVLSVWIPKETPVPSTVMQRAETAARTLPYRSDFTGWMSVAGRKEWRLVTAAIKNLALSLGMRPGAKTITPEIERQSSAFYAGFIAGLFDADGSVQGNQTKGLSIRLAQSDLKRLEAVQRMLARLGIISRIYRARREKAWRTLPDGKGGSQDYQTQEQHELVISGSNIAIFHQRIRLGDEDKQTRLDQALTDYKRALNRERFVVKVVRVDPDGSEPVFDVSIPGINAFDANGFYVHNCGEQPLPPYGACLLGSVNLARFIADPFTDKARLDEQALDRTVRTAIRLMDNVVDVSGFPLEAQAEEARAKRRIGLGVTGLADALIMMRTAYGSDPSLRLTATWLKAVSRAAYAASIDLAREKGPFPLFDKDAYLAGETIQGLDEDLRAGIAAHGIRNALLTSIAPTGTISLLADNVSSGIEPVFSFTYTRKVLDGDGTKTDHQVDDYAYRLFREKFGPETPLPDYFVSTQTLPPLDHVAVQAAAQPFIDSSISKTINVPESISFDEFKDVYWKAYESGCKGCTTYRPNPVTGSVLSVDTNAAKKISLPSTQTDGDFLSEPLDRPGALQGRTYKVRWPESDHAIYITINDIEKDGRIIPFEIFINSKNMEHYAWTVALTRMISAVFRRGGDVSFVVEELKAVFDPRGGYWKDGRYMPSILAAIGEVIEEHMIAIGFLPPDAAPSLERIAGGAADGLRGRTCPRCGQPAMIRQENCDTCHACGYSKCA